MADDTGEGLLEQASRLARVLEVAVGEAGGLGERLDERVGIARRHADAPARALEHAGDLGARVLAKSLDVTSDGAAEHMPVADASIDVILSNCVINLSPDKPRVFAEIQRWNDARMMLEPLLVDGGYVSSSRIRELIYFRYS